VKKTLLFGITTWNMNRRERMMEEKRNAVAIPSVLTDEVENGEVR
jgi:negative regulator of replication initiation